MQLYQNGVLNGENVYYVWENDGVWVSALRLYYIEENFYYLEALETAPDFRKKGYAALLLTSVINELKLIGHFKICVCVGRNNIASLNTHKKCGFKIVSENGFDYLQKETDDRCYGLEYSF
ncbi:MAG: GNAT family N-acetyltransferase [Corallococcus sp.]|nr:GNAT family N-acetyltransferase [Corallococcus sp.]